MNELEIKGKEYMYLMEPFNPEEDCNLRWRIFLASGIYFGAIHYTIASKTSRFWYADHLQTCNTVNDTLIPLAALYDFLGCEGAK